MKLNKNFLLHNTGSESILVPTGAAGFSGAAGCSAAGAAGSSANVASEAAARSVVAMRVFMVWWLGG